MTQKQKVMQYLHEFGSITPLDAMREFGIMRLAAVVFDIKNEDGERIATQLEKSKNRFGENVIYARYVLERNGE